MSGDVRSRRSRKDLLLPNSQQRQREEEEDAVPDFRQENHYNTSAKIIVLALLLILAMAAAGAFGYWRCFPVGSSSSFLADMFRRSDPKLDSEDWTPEIKRWIRQKDKKGRMVQGKTRHEIYSPQFENNLFGEPRADGRSRVGRSEERSEEAGGLAQQQRDQAHIGGLAAKPVPYPAAAAAPVTATKAEVLRRGVMSCLDGVLKQVMMDQDHDDKIASGG